ncbi:phosphatase PAP2 family protein [Gordonia sp. GONU]|uniref:phosphatase PAP2 family protein n=1 Tax=Gordonia sp. GONU TaxID=2972949 RepID=UPI0021AD2FCA|nr:phosphatase PAP2 family protein [Gordonia sp. GONU]MCR8897456.1 phosphatase PAP2 family protein [Gordonia sp. GONU]
MSSSTIRGLFAGVLILGVCALGAALATHGGPLAIDQTVMTWVFDHRHQGMVSAVSTVSDLFSPGMVILWTLVIATWLFLRDRTLGRAAAVVGGVVAAGAFTEIVKLSVHRPRPPMHYHAGITEMTLSYPSGHVTGTTALALTTAVVATAGASRRSRMSVVGAGLAISLVAAATRLYLGVHWFSDVLAAFAVGAAAALIIPTTTDAVMSGIRRRGSGRVPGWFAPYPHAPAKGVCKHGL